MPDDRVALRGLVHLHIFPLSCSKETNFVTRLLIWDRLLQKEFFDPYGEGRQN